MWAVALTALALALPHGCLGGKVDEQPTPAYTATGAVTPVRVPQMNGMVEAFYYLQYAKAPKGSLRFRNPNPPMVNTEVVDTKNMEPSKAISVLHPNKSMPKQACAQHVGGIVVGTEDCLKLILWRRTGEHSAESPVMIWFHGGWAVYGDAWGVLGEYEGASITRLHSTTVASVQYRLGMPGFLYLDDLGPPPSLEKPGRDAFEDQRVAMLYLRDNAPGLEINKSRTLIFGHNAGAWSLCQHVLQFQRNIDLDGPVFTGVIMQSGFCDDVTGSRRNYQSTNILQHINRYCSGRGDGLFACLTQTNTSNLVLSSGDIMEYCNRWTRPFFRDCKVPANEPGHALPIFPSLLRGKKGKSRFAQMLGVAGTSVIDPMKALFWPWGEHTGAASMLRIMRPQAAQAYHEYDKKFGRHAILQNRGDGLDGEPYNLRCTYQVSSVFFAMMGAHMQLQMMCAIGCGETLRDTGSDMFTHGGEIPYVFATWLNPQALKRIRKWKQYKRHKGSSQTTALATFATSRCIKPKYVALENFFYSEIRFSPHLKPIDYATWVEIYYLPRLGEKLRPNKKDAKDSQVISWWWALFNYAKEIKYEVNKNESNSTHGCTS